MADDKLFTATLMPDADWWQALWPDPGSVLTKSGVKHGMSVVDLCCGNGYFSKPLCNMIASGSLYAIDLDEALLTQAEAAVCGANYKNAYFVLADACRLSEFVKEEIDLVFLANTFHGVPNKTALSSSVNFVLKEEGKFVIVNWHKRPREETVVLNQARGPDTILRMSVEEVQQEVEPAGFTLDKIVDVGPYHYAAIFCKERKLKS